MVLSSRELLFNGESAGIRIGLTPEAVVSMLGEPDDRSANRPVIFKYGRLELTFVEDRLVLIALYGLEGASDVGPITIRNDLPRPGSIERIVWMLSQEGLEWVKVDALCFGSQYGVHVVESGATALFEDGVLCSVQVAD